MHGRRREGQVDRRAKTLIGVLLLAAGAVSSVLAQTSPKTEAYPVSTIEVIVPFTAGGAVDVTGRIVSSFLSRTMSRTFIVLNKPGANSNIGNMAVARAKPDGQTLLVSSIGLAANKSLYKNLGYDPLRDLTPISLISNAPLGLFVTKSVPVSDLNGLLAYLKANPGKLNYASYGPGSSPHLAAEMFKNLTGVKIEHIPFNGNGPAVTATIAGVTEIIFCSTVAAGPFVESGQLKPIALAADKRLAQFPDLKTFRELGIDFTMGTWFGLLGPANLPRALVDALAESVKKLPMDAEAQKAFEKQGADFVVSSPDEFAAFLKAENDKLAGVIKAAGITSE
jgi:tripartite-type tricarboxylate transporter receptor subunit TctC